jgi:LuxR family maltose regulon positive regulatory protein
MPGWSSTSYIALARLRQILGDEPGARQALQAARQHARSTETTLDDVYLEVHAARLALLQRDLPSAARWASEWERKPEPEAPQQGQDLDGLIKLRMFHELGQATLVRVHLARGDTTKALAVLEPLLGAGSAMRSRIELLALRALIRRALGHRDAAMEDLEEALALAEPEGFIRTFIDDGEPMARLLREAARRGPAPGYARRLLDAMAPREGPAAATGERPSEGISLSRSFVEPPTEREMQVLRLLQSSLNTPEIAGELGIAPSTVRTYVKNLYGKLGVHRRADAVERAKEVGLLRS